MATLKHGFRGSKRGQRPPFGSGRPAPSVPAHFYRPARRGQHTTSSQERLHHVVEEAELVLIRQALQHAVLSHKVDDGL